MQVSSRTVNGAVSITGNAAKAKSQGLEFSFNARVTDEITLSGNYSYNDAKLTSNAPDVVDGIYDVFSGDRLPGTPKHAGAFTVAYDTRNLPQSPTSGIFSSFSEDFAGVGGDVNYFRSVVDTRGYYPLTPKVTLVGRVQGCLAVRASGWAGGDRLVRCFGQQSAAALAAKAALAGTRPGRLVVAVPLPALRRRQAGVVGRLRWQAKPGLQLHDPRRQRLYLRPQRMDERVLFLMGERRQVGKPVHPPA